MSEATLSPVEIKGGGKAANTKQVALLAVLGLALVVLLVVQLPKLLGGGSSEPAPAPAPAPAAGAPSAGPAIGSAPEATTPAPPPARPRRNPFDGPR
jgi:hypothetical protein